MEIYKIIFYTAFFIGVSTLLAYFISRNINNKKPKQLTETTFTDAFHEALHKKLTSGKVEAALDVAVEKLVDAVIKETFESYGEVSKAMKEKIKQSLVPAIENISDFPMYHNFVVERLKAAMQNFQDERLAKVLEDDFAQIFTEIPSELTLTWLIAKLAETAMQDTDEEGAEITLHIVDNKWNWGWATPGQYLDIFFDPGTDVAQKDCKYHIDLQQHKDGRYTISGVNINGKKPNENGFTLSRFYNYDKMIANLFVMKGELKFDKGIDVSNYDLTFERPDPECYCD